MALLAHVSTLTTFYRLRPLIVYLSLFGCVRNSLVVRLAVKNRISIVVRVKIFQEVIHAVGDDV
jgi:hypothetical protein